MTKPRLRRLLLLLLVIVEIRIVLSRSVVLAVVGHGLRLPLLLLLVVRLLLRVLLPRWHTCLLIVVLHLLEAAMIELLLLLVLILLTHVTVPVWLSVVLRPVAIERTILTTTTAHVVIDTP